MGANQQFASGPSIGGVLSEHPQQRKQLDLQRVLQDGIGPPISGGVDERRVTGGPVVAVAACESGSVVVQFRVRVLGATPLIDVLHRNRARPASA